MVVERDLWQERLSGQARTSTIVFASRNVELELAPTSLFLLGSAACLLLLLLRYRAYNVNLDTNSAFVRRFSRMRSRSPSGRPQNRESDICIKSLQQSELTAAAPPSPIFSTIQQCVSGTGALS